MPRMFHATFLLLPVGGAEGAEDGGVKVRPALTLELVTRELDWHLGDGAVVK
jgi:hypothetical protein